MKPITEENFDEAVKTTEIWVNLYIAEVSSRHEWHMPFIVKEGLLKFIREESFDENHTGTNRESNG